MTELDVAVLLTTSRKELGYFHKLKGSLGTRQELSKLADKLAIAAVQAPRTRLKKKARKLMETINAELVVDAFKNEAEKEQRYATPE